MDFCSALSKDLSKIPIGFPTNQSYICHSWFSLNSLFFETPCIHTFVHTVDLQPISFHPYILQLYIFPPTLITFKTSWFLKLNSNLGWSILNLGGMRPAGASDILLSFYFCNIDVVVGRKSRQCCAHEQENAHQQISCEKLARDTRRALFCGKTGSIEGRCVFNYPN